MREHNIKMKHRIINTHRTVNREQETGEGRTLVDTGNGS